MIEMNLNELSQKLEDHLTDQDIQDAQELLDDTYQEIVDMRGELVEAQAEMSALRTQAIADAARIAELEASLAARGEAIQDANGRLIAAAPELLAALESIVTKNAIYHRPNDNHEWTLSKHQPDGIQKAIDLIAKINGNQAIAKARGES